MAKTKKQKAEELLGNVNDIQAKAGESPFVETEIETGKDGTGFFDGMKPKVLTIPELNAMVKNVKTNLIPAFQKAQKALSVAKEEIFQLANQHKEHFEFDEEKNAYIYDDGVVHLEIEEKETITYDLIDESGEKKGAKK